MVDPEADLVRGRARLHRTRRTHLAVLSGAAAVVIAAPVAVTLVLTSPSTSVPQAPAIASKAALPAVNLVAYTGEQVPGYRVSEVPAGWEIQGGNQFALVLAPKEFADQNTDSFVGKIVVMLASKDQSVPGEGTPITVDGRPGAYHTEAADPGNAGAVDTTILRFVGADGRGVVVQVPASLGWDAAHLARFGAGVSVLGNADPGVG